MEESIILRGKLMWDGILLDRKAEIQLELHDLAKQLTQEQLLQLFNIFKEKDEPCLTADEPKCDGWHKGKSWIAFCEEEYCAYCGKPIKAKHRNDTEPCPACFPDKPKKEIEKLDSGGFRAEDFYKIIDKINEIIERIGE